MDRLTKEQRHRNMSLNKGKGTKLEILFSKLLWNAGIRYRKNDKDIFGKPDFVIRKMKIAIFCDGEFWHGRDWEIRKNDHKSNCEFWHKKIERNIERDKEVNEKLESQGWKVFRFWESEITKEPDKCLNRILSYMKAKSIPNERISITEICKGGRILLQIYGPHSLNDDGTVLPFEEQMAIVSHYMHNKGNRYGDPYRYKAKGLIEDIYNIQNKPAGKCVSDPWSEYSLFSDLFSVPFLPIENPKFTFIDLFAGIGGFRMAMQNLGGKCVFSSEWDAQARKTYLLNYGEVPFGDITKEATKSFIPDDFDILCAGFPCQAFSLAGKRLGFEETRGTLFFDVAEIIRRKRPKAFFLENVKGLLIHDKGKTIQTILNVLREDLDYYVPDPQIINAKNFGVPQHRERVFIVGFRKDQNTKEFCYPNSTDKTKTFADIKEEEPVSAKYYLSTQYLKTLVAHKERHAAKGNGFGYEIIPDDGIANAIVVGGMGRERNLVVDKRLENFTPVTNIKGEINRDGLRRMTPREWARLQGFPDDFIIGVADASAYKQFGNSVAVPAIQATGQEIIKRLKFPKNKQYEFSKKR
ncbi:DNA (cytosine-5-)-methyltransferase [Porphyromonas gingivalis]|uniref:DNA mismatch endonuclease Vsr n=1 Tax=Porphyromonas gingivalis TaxID=837 RepID=UPI0003AD5D56|nr:DNA mismatch endonuclease Vsr [Porphyromonas gingivalis]ERJ67699.1 DNA mismatch endonuclease Vsr [Porphyromonas gingivalis F0569]OWP29461.1 DNA (cytosine-5-)-methyltransferase [Porphyromonas gingivalis]